MRIQSRLAELAARKSRLEGRKITISGIAEATGLQRNTVSAYWNNTVTKYEERILLALCDYLGCYLDDLLVQVPDGSDLDKLVREDDSTGQLMALA